MYQQDQRIVMTLDAGGTNFVFSAVRGCEEIIEPVCMKANTDQLNKCLNTLVQGFEMVRSKLISPPVAISFAFPGPADYANGVIGDLPNFKAFRNGVALGPYLSHIFKLPVFINNDGNLFAYGEAMKGALVELNLYLANSGSKKQFQNLIGITLGTGFGCGIVIGNKFLVGDNGCASNVWNFSSYSTPSKIAEDSISIRAVKRVYSELSGLNTDHLTPKDIFEIANGDKEGDKDAARLSFETLGRCLGDALAYVVGIIDGAIVLGGGMIGAYKFIVPGLIKVLESRLSSFSGEYYPRVLSHIHEMSNLSSNDFGIKSEYIKVAIPGTTLETDYRIGKNIVIMESSLGTSSAISIGAYIFALNKLDQKI